MSKQLFYYYCNSTEIPFYRKKYENVLSRNLFDNRTIYTTKIFNQTGKKLFRSFILLLLLLIIQ